MTPADGGAGDPLAPGPGRASIYSLEGERLRGVEVRVYEQVPELPETEPHVSLAGDCRRLRPEDARRLASALIDAARRLECHRSPPGP